MGKRLRHSIFVLFLTVLLAPQACLSQVTVILVRHAEKGSTPPNDPPLTEAGQRRANLLASMFADSGVDAIYVTGFRRTQQTAAPLAERTHVKPTVLSENSEIIKAIRARQSGVVLVVGHSNSIPEIIAGLGGPKITIPDPEYDNLFILTVEGSKSSLLRMHYGDPAKTPSRSGTIMMTPPK